MSSQRGKFIVFEGLDGCGKSTQLEKLRVRLNTCCRSAGTRKIFPTREPSDSIPGVICRAVSKKSIQLSHPESEALLFACDRYEHIQKEILPQLQAGNHVLCDRFFLSNFAYQSNTSSFDSLLHYNSGAIELATPDITVFIDASPEECERRRAIERATEEKYEKVEHARLVQKEYQTAIDYFKSQGHRFIIVPGDGDPEEIFEKLWIELTRSVFSEDDYQ